jgi:putative oxidoreductase
MKSLFFKVTKENNIWNELSITVLRLYVGFAMAFAHGFGKIPPPERLIEGVTGMGFPMPAVFAWAAALSEFLGGILLAIGLFTRPSAFFLGFTMCVAGFVAHGQDPFDKKELALFYAASCLVFLFRGASGFSVDRFFVGKKKK